MKADIMMRSEEWLKAQRRMARLHATAPHLTDYNPTMPWDSEIRASASDESFGRNHVETPAMRAEYRQEAPHSSLFGQVA